MSLCVAVLCFLFPVPPLPPFFIISSCNGAKQVFGAVIKTILDKKKPLICPPEPAGDA